MPEATTTKQKLQKRLEGSPERGGYDGLVEDIYESFKSVDAAVEYLRELCVEAESAAEQAARDLHERAGVLAFAIGDYRTAVAQLEHIKTRREAAYFLGRACAGLGHTEEALASLGTARMADRDFETDMLIADVLCQKRETEEADKLCKTYGRSHANDPDLLYAKGRVHEANGEYGEAMECYEKALEQNPDHRGSLFRLALNCDLNGDDERAVELYQRCALLKPTFVGALMNLGVLHDDVGRYEQAARCYRRVLALDPAHSRARLYLKDAEASLTMVVSEERKQLGRPRDEVLALPVTNFELSARCKAVLDKLNVRTLGDLSRLTGDELLEFKNFGETSLEEIKTVLARNGLLLSSSQLGEGEMGSALTVEDEELREKLSTPVELLGLSTRSRKCMDRLNITTVGELIQRTEEELLSTPNFGRTSVAEIRTRLAEMGLALREE